MSKRQAAAPSAPEPSTTRFTKRLHVAIASTMANFFADGSGSGTWSIMPDKAAKLFGDSVSDMTSSLNSIKNAYIIECKMLECKSSFPAPIGVSINCIPPMEVTDTGQMYAFTTLPMSHSHQQYLLFQADMNSSENNQWRNSFREYNKDNLGSHNVLDVQGAPYKFVHESHPVITLLSANKELLGNDIATHSKIDGEWFKIGTQVLNTALATLSSKILSKVPCQDLSQLQVQLKRIDATEWNDHSDFLEEHKIKEENIFDRPCTFMCRLEITYELPK